MAARTAKKTAKLAKPSPRNGNQLPLGNHPGNTGGKKGRSGAKPERIRQLCRDIVDQNNLIQTLADIANSKKEVARDRLAAITKLLEYGYGKPQQSIDVTTGGEPMWDLTRLSDADLTTLDALSRRAAAKNGDRG